VRPTNCGRMVDRRDHILMTSLRPDARAFSALRRRWPSTKGPFQTERATRLSLLAQLATAHDQLVRTLVVAGLVALGRLAPRGDGMTAARGAAFAAAERMVDRVHRHAAVVRAETLPAHAAGLADRHV